MNEKKKGKNILIVDDDDGIRDLVTEMLNDLGHYTSHAKDGESALRIIAEKGNEIDLIISDVEMPGNYNGLDLVDKIKQFYPLKPIVVFMSGYDIDLDEVYSRGVCSFIKKPFSFDSFSSAINDGIEQLPTYLRKYDRIDIALDVKLVIDSLDVAINSNIVNIGQGGIFVKTDAKVEIGQKVDFNIVFAKEALSSLSGVGEVVWTRRKDAPDAPSGIGIKFLSLTDEQRAFIQALVVQRKIMAFIPKK